MAQAATQDSTAANAFRLSPTVRPTRQALDLMVDPNESRFRGMTTIEVALSEMTDCLWLHAVDLDVTRAEVRARGKTFQAGVRPGANGRIGIVPPEPLQPGVATIALSFEGTMDATRSQGIYREREGNDQYAYTFFEPIDARRAFPCFDEPSFKVPWSLTLRIPPNDRAASNTETVDEHVEPSGLKVVTFAPTKPLPSYLVAFIVGPFDVVSRNDGPNGRPIRIFVPRGRAPETRYALAHANAFVGILEEQMGVPYPYEKLDIAVVPRYWGSMEHPGLVALGQPLTLIPPDDETFARTKWFANIALHELSHYWFGDSVTTAWWDDTWLNEAFATWADLKATHKFAPAWGMPFEELGRKHTAITGDMLASAKPVRAPVLSETDIIGSFEASSTYYKGASVLRMLERFVGEAVFRRVIAAHLVSHANGNATMEDFLGALKEQAGGDAADILRAFVTRPGVPVLDMALSCESGKPAHVRIAQERLVVAGATVSPSPPWPIPVCVRYGDERGSHRTCQVLRTRDAEVPLEGGTCPTWLVGEDSGIGYYVTSYSTDLVTKALAVGSGASLIERLAVAHDLRALTRGGRIRSDELLAVLGPLARDGSPEALRFVVDVLAPLGSVVADADRPAFAALVRRVLGPSATRLGFVPARDAGYARVQPDLLTLVARDGADHALGAQATRLATTWLQTHSGVSDTLLEQVLTIAASRGDRVLFTRYRAAALATERREDKKRLFAAMGAFPDPKLCAEALSLLLDPSVDLRESRAILDSAVDTNANRELAFQFLLEHISKLVARLRDDQATWLFQASQPLCDERHAARAERELAAAAARIDGGPAALRKAVERTRACASTREERVMTLHKFLVRTPLR